MVAQTEAICGGRAGLTAGRHIGAETEAGESEILGLRIPQSHSRHEHWGAGVRRKQQKL